MGVEAAAGRSWRSLSFAAIQLTSAGAGLLGWVLLPRVASGIEQEPAIIAFALGPILALPLTLGVPATLPNAFRRGTGGRFERPQSWVGPMRMVGGTVSVAAILGVGLAIAAWMFELSFVTASLVLAYGASMGTWLISAQVARIRESNGLMLAGGLLNPMLPFVWMLLIGSGFSERTAAPVSVLVMSALCATIWFGMRDLLQKQVPFSRGGARRVLLQASVLVPHLALFALLMQGVRVSAIFTDDASLLAQAHLAALGVTMVSVMVNSIHALLAVQIQTAEGGALLSTIRVTAVGYRWLALVSTVIVIVFYLALPFMSGVGVPFIVVVPLGLSVPAIVLYYASSTIQLRTGSARRLLVASSGAVAAWLVATAVAHPATLIGIACVYAIAPSVLAIVAVCLGSFSRVSETRLATRLMFRKLAPMISACMLLLIGAGGVSVALAG